MRISRTLRATVLLRTVALVRIPMVAFLRPRVVQYDDEKVVVCIPLSRRVRNHVGTMYVGALCSGADCAGGLMAMDLAWKRGNKVKVLFKDMKAEFLQRPDGDVHFRCEDGRAIEALMQRAQDTGERCEGPITVVATVPSKSEDKPVARFVMTLSAKRAKG